MTHATPKLWHIDVSHYSEKARWALAHKRVAHRRQAPIAGAHMAFAAWLTRGAAVTFPILTVDGRHVADSTAIIAALEERYPDPALYPAEPDRRRRALELEDYFDEELGPHVRLLGWHELRKDRQRLAAVIERTSPPLARVSGAAATYASSYVALRFGARDAAAAERARGKVLAAFDRLEAELEREPGDYLVGEGFSVADLTAASLFYPVVVPPEGPLPADAPLPAGFAGFRDSLKDRRGFGWVEEMFRRHRRPAAATPQHA